MELIKSKFHENKDWNCSQGIRISFFHSHQEQVPRKQGLKRFGVVASGAPSDPIKSKFHENKDWNKMCIRGPFPAIRASRASSTKTRIETPMRPFASKTRFPSRASSTKTRIETSGCCNVVWPPGPHQEQVPRKQGLKLHTLIVILCFAKSSRASSTKTRIETWWGSMTIFKDQASRASSTKTRIETPMSPGRGSHVTDGKPVILSRPC